MIWECFQNISITSVIDYPRFSLFQGSKEIADNNVILSGIGVLEIVLAFVPIALVSFSEHIADHKNLSTVIDRDLLTDPGLNVTLLGDVVGHIIGSVFGFCPCTTYSQSVGCVAMTKNASIWTMIVTSIMCIILAFLTPFIAALQTIPSCVMGGICLALYGFIAVSGLRMLQGINIAEGKNLYTLSVILISGIGALTLRIPYQMGLFGDGITSIVIRYIEISSIAIALILGIVTYLISGAIEKHNKQEEE